MAPAAARSSALTSAWEGALKVRSQGRGRGAFRTLVFRGGGQWAEPELIFITSSDSWREEEETWAAGRPERARASHFQLVTAIRKVIKLKPA